MTTRVYKLLLIVLILLAAVGCGRESEAGPGAAESGHADHGDHGGAPEDGSGHSHDGGGELRTQVIFAFPDGKPGAGQPTKLSIRLTDEEGRPVEAFDVTHEKLMHLIVVDRQLSYFSHLHPDYAGEGVFTVETTFPAGGEYKLFADFQPTGASAVTIGKRVEVDGASAEAAALAPDETLKVTVEGKKVELRAEAWQAGTEMRLTFHISDAATGRPIETLEPYLGAIGHVVILSEDAEGYLHVHPAEEQATGPEAVFRTSFPAPGLYKIWAQFQHEGKVFTVPFTVEVQ